MVSFEHQNFQSRFLPQRTIDADIWTAHLPSSMRGYSYFRSLLSQDELQKASSFRFDEHKQNYTISRGVLRCLLGMYLNKNPQEIQILYGLWRKPCVANEFSFFFNLSHSGDYVSYVFSSKQEVGIDIEFIDTGFNADAMVKNILSSPDEYAYWNSVKGKDTVYEFYKFWVCKEAFLKASGTGWLEKNTALPADMLESLKAKKNDGISNCKNIPYVFDLIPGYIGAFYWLDNDTRVIPTYHLWKMSGSN